eukprot:TRINITY_DN7564_c0_g1_i4.p1 TRINITY_DN7564_c0_g1~~TRINITY_DN7564_c0_g1_i4.p1  ORF type:complete len:597 (+),score=151.88 TRINITY_DN7564_c0_g1_i4:62-1792(+)
MCIRDRSTWGNWKLKKLGICKVKEDMASGEGASNEKNDQLCLEVTEVQENNINTVFTFQGSLALNEKDPNSSNLIELSQSIKDKLEDLKSIRLDLSKRFTSINPEEPNENRQRMEEENAPENHPRIEEVEGKHKQETDRLIAQFKESRQAYESQIQSLQEELRSRDSLIDHLRESNLSLAQKTVWMEQELLEKRQPSAEVSHHLKKQADMVNSAVQKVAENFVNKEEELRRLQEDYETILVKLSFFEETIRKYREKLADRSKELENAIIQNRKVNAESAQQRRLIENLQEEIKNLKSVAQITAEKEKETDLSSTKSRIDQLNTSLDLLPTLSDNYKLIEKLQAENQELLERLDSYRKENFALKLEKEKMMIIESEKAQKEINMKDRLDSCQDYLLKFKELEAKMNQLEADKVKALQERDHWFTKSQEMETKIAEVQKMIMDKIPDTMEPEDEVLTRKGSRIRSAPTANDFEVIMILDDDMRAKSDDKAHSKTSKIEETAKNIEATKKKEKKSRVIVTICPTCCLLLNRNEKVAECASCANSVHVKCLSTVAIASKPDGKLCSICAKATQKEAENCV